jgi:type III restriction enzyme
LKFELKEFQEIKCRELRGELATARDEFSKRFKRQAIVLSSPTGSGKTITIGALLESIFEGDDNYPSEPRTRVLWISDSPELNNQSRDKLLAACDTPTYQELELIDSDTFDEEFLREGAVYFINTQLLGRDKRLTKEGGDQRTFTFWQTVANTVREYGPELLLIIDEAHRGMGVSAREREARTTIIRKFIDGSKEDGLPPLPIILGMSATTRRFDDVLGETQQRTVRKVTITPEEVRTSGLIKDQMVVIVPTEPVNTDMTLLERAVRRWREFEETWDDYSRKEGDRFIYPALVVQVEDGVPGRDVLSKTPLDQVVEIIRREGGTLGQGAIAHCFEVQRDLVLGNTNVRRVDASRIEQDKTVRIILFKTALGVGWDCPRAEVMMSFRKAIDPTVIAQLIGRMIRSVFARRIEAYEMLNTVELFLPHYDQENLETILTELRNPDAEDRVATDVTTTPQVSYQRNPAFEEAFSKLEGLKTAIFSSPAPLLPVRRLLKLAWYLTTDKLDEECYEQHRNDIVRILLRHREARWKEKEDWASVVRETGEVELQQFIVGLGKMEVSEAAVRIRAELAPENVEALFKEALRRIAPGTDVNMAFWREAEKKTDPLLAKLELYALSNDASILKELNEHANKRFDALDAKHRSATKTLKERRRQLYSKLRQAGREFIFEDWELPEQILERADGRLYDRHLYADSAGKFQTKLNGWEDAVLARWAKRDGFVGWLRNPSRRQWSFTIPYQHGGSKGFHPDLVVIRRASNKLVIDVLEPHQTNQDDTFAKAKGLADYASTHGLELGQAMMLTVDGQGDDALISGFDVTDRGVREKVLRTRDNEQIQGLFQPLAELKK